MKLTKEVVDALLAINTKNRTYSHIRVEALARSMLNGEFIPGNGQTIVVNESFSWLLDGQHRLLAIAMAGYPVFDIDVKVVPDEDAEKTFNTIDVNHGARTSGQILALSRDINDASSVCAVARAVSMFAWKEPSLSVYELGRAIDDMKDDIDFVMSHRYVCGKTVSSGYLAGVVNAMRIGNREKVRGEWISICNSRIDERNTALKTLIPYIVGARLMREPQGQQFFRATKALLFPELQKTFVTISDDLRCKCPHEKAKLDTHVFSKAKTRDDKKIK